MRLPAARATLLAATLLVLAGCAVIGPPAYPDRQAMPPEVGACNDWYAALERQTRLAGVHDAGARPVDGFAHLRVDRFTASLATDQGAARSGSDNTTRHAALLQRLVQLDLDTRRHEIANLPAQARVALGAAAGIGPLVDDLWRTTQACAVRLQAFDLGHPQRMARVLERLVVPDDYVTGYRVFGLYALSRIPFAAGVRRYEAEQSATFARDSAPAPGTTRLRLSPPGRPPAHSMTSSHLRAMLAPPPDAALAVTAPTPAQLEQLFAHFAPIFEFEIGNEDDRPGALVWREQALAVATSTPVVYRQTAFTRYQGRNLLQLVYTVWFAARRPTGAAALDLLAGKLDGVVFRVTLSPDGTPLLYDSIHPCGCYHLFFPTPAARPKPAPEESIEWAFSPRSLPAIGPQDRIVVRVAGGTHYVEQLDVVTDDSASRYAWRNYDELRSLAGDAGVSRSVFDQDGFIPGTERAESWLFWPMGIPRAGMMRQWGRHATAFVGRRHFDDADLLEQRFELDLGPP